MVSLTKCFAIDHHRLSNFFNVRLPKLTVQFSIISVHVANTDSFDERGEFLPSIDESLRLILQSTFLLILSGMLPFLRRI
jgi:hypothetical protein